MNIGEAARIFLTIADERYTDDQKGTAIMQVLDMPTHNGIPKDAMLCVIWYLLNLSFALPAGAEPPQAWKNLVKTIEGGERG